MFIDVHTHIQQHDPAELPGIIERASNAGVGAIIAAGVTIEDSRRCLEIAREQPRVFAGIGVHPADLPGELTGSDLDALTEMAGDSRVVAMSEIGLDYMPDSPDHALQERALRSQIAIAREHRLPVIFHVREAQADALRVLAGERAGELGGAAHYFQGDWAYAKAMLDLGFNISLAKPLLRLPELQDVAARIPLDRIVLETDAYPQPFKSKREKWTEPKDVPVVAVKLAELHGIDVDAVRERTTANALAMLGPRTRLVEEILATGP